MLVDGDNICSDLRLIWRFFYFPVFYPPKPKTKRKSQGTQHFYSHLYFQSTVFELDETAIFYWLDKLNMCRKLQFCFENFKNKCISLKVQ